MESIMNHVADLFFWGSAAVLVWGMVLTLGQVFAAGKPRTHASAPNVQNDRRRPLAAN